MSDLIKKYYKDLSILLQPRQMNFNYDWVQEFGCDCPLEIEIGFGNGEYLKRLSESNPNTNYIGLEVAWNSIKRALRKLNFSENKGTNVRLMLMHAEHALRFFIKENSLNKVLALFPVPWPAERHESRRLFSTRFLNLVANRLKDSAVFEIVTDSEQLMNWILLQAKDSAINFELNRKYSFLNTKYERKWKSNGQEIFFQLIGRKTMNPPVSEIKGVEVQALYINQFEPDKFKPSGINGDLTIKFLDFIYDAEKKVGLLPVMVFEDGLKQEFFIKIANYEDKWKVSIAMPGQVFPTNGIARALELAALGS